MNENEHRINRRLILNKLGNCEYFTCASPRFVQHVIVICYYLTGYNRPYSIVVKGGISYMEIFIVENA